MGDDDDQVDVSDWLPSGSQTINGTAYNVYVLGVTTLYVDSDIDALLS